MKLQVVLCVLLQLLLERSSCTHLLVPHGSALELPCLLFRTDFTDVTITWKFNGHNVSAESTGSVRVKKGGYLSIFPVTAANEGEYLCLAKDNNVVTTSTYKVAVEASFAYTIKAFAGSTVPLPCYFPPGSQVTANALWFKETEAGGTRTSLSTEGDSTDDSNRLSLLYPLDIDQTILIRDTVMEDAGIYHCESAEGKKLSTMNISVEVAPTPVPHTCGAFATAWEPCPDESSHTGAAVLQESLAEFSMKLYSFLRESHPSGNLLISPISISGILSHLLLGARDQTRRAIERAVCLPHDFHCVHLQMKKLREKLSGSLQMASQIYYNPQMNLTESFTNQSIGFYDSEPTRLLESSEENTAMVNSWVAQKTKNKITQLVDSISPSTQLILLNAVSFSGQWKVKFNDKPRKGLFTKLNGDMVKVPLLYHQRYTTAVIYAVELKAQVARFALSGDSSLYVLLPRSNGLTELQQLEEKMTDTAVLRMIEQMKTTPTDNIEVYLPQIKLDVQPDINVLIKKLGLSSLFEDANLCGLFSEGKLALDDARHRAFLALTEQGVEAGAVTTLVYSRSYPSFSAMRPFIMLLWSDQANVPLFIGRVTDP